MKENENKSTVIISLLGIIPIVWVALKIAPSVNGGLKTILPTLMNVFNNPLSINLCEDSLKTVLILLIAYGLGIGVYLSSKKNYRHGEEHGSAKWGSVRKTAKKYKSKDKCADKIFTKKVSVSYNMYEHRRNMNSLICGGSGSGKTRFYCKPNLMQCNTSFFVLDPNRQL